MARVRKRQSNSQLADELLTWARAHGVIDDVYVQQLVAALTSGDHLDYWSRYDNLDLLPIPSSQVGKTQLRRSDALISFRNIMVFVPVAFTWAGISQATTAFSDYASVNANKVVNFFDFWENGYGVLNKFWTLSNIARVDFFLLTLVILASVLITVFQSQAKRLIAGAEKIDERNRMLLGLKLNQYLFDFREPTPVVVNQQISQTLANLRKASVEISKTSRILNKGLAKMIQVTPASAQLLTIKTMIAKLKK